MKLFQEASKNFEALGISSIQQPKVDRNFLKTSFIYILTVIACVVFFFHEAKTLQEYVNIGCVANEVIAGIIVFTTFALKSKKLFEYIANVNDYCEKTAKDSVSKEIYDKFDRLIEKWTKIGHLVISKVSPVCWIFPKATISYFNYFTTSLGHESFESPVPIWCPFDWKNPVGYLGFVFLQYIATSNHFALVGCLATFGLGNYLAIVAMIKNLRLNIIEINESAKIRKNQKDTLNLLADFIQNHGHAKQFIYDISEIYQPVSMVISLNSLAAICGALLLIQIEIKDFDDISVLFLTIFNAAYAFGTIFTICELGQRATTETEVIDNSIRELEWNLFSHEIQRMLPILLIASQQPIEFTFFGSFAALRETFKKVVNSAFSYFMVFREFF